MADTEEFFFLSSLTHISHLLLLPSVLFNLFTTHWLQIGICSKHNPPQIPTLSSVLFLQHVQGGCCFHCKDEDFQELEDGLGEGALEKAEHLPPESRSHGSGLGLQNISSSYCCHSVNMHNMNITKAMITTKSTFPVYVFSNLSCTANEHIFLFIYLFIYFYYSRGSLSVSWGQYCPCLAHLRVIGLKKSQYTLIFFKSI